MPLSSRTLVRVSHIIRSGLLRAAAALTTSHFCSLITRQRPGKPRVRCRSCWRPHLLQLAPDLQQAAVHAVRSAGSLMCCLPHLNSPMPALANRREFASQQPLPLAVCSRRRLRPYLLMLQLTGSRVLLERTRGLSADSYPRKQPCSSPRRTAGRCISTSLKVRLRMSASSCEVPLLCPVHCASSSAISVRPHLMQLVRCSCCMRQSSVQTCGGFPVLLVCAWGHQGCMSPQRDMQRLQSAIWVGCRRQADSCCSQRS